MVDVEHTKPPVRTVRMTTDEGVKVINVRRHKGKKVPPVPTGDRLMCPHCGELHPVLKSVRGRSLLTFNCPVIGHPMLYMKKTGQEYIKSLIVADDEPEEPKSKSEPVIDKDLLKSLREAIDG